MAPVGPRPTREETRERILVTAEDYFKRFGYDRSTVADLAAALGMSSANIYKFFSSKDAIVEAIGDRVMDEFRKELVGVLSSKQTALEKIENVFYKVYQFNKKKLSRDIQIYKIVLRSYEENWKCRRDFDEVMTKITTDLIELGIENGEFRVTDSLVTAKILLDSCVWITYPILFYKLDHDSVESRLHRQVQFMGQSLK